MHEIGSYFARVRGLVAGLLILVERGESIAQIRVVAHSGQTTNGIGETTYPNIHGPYEYRGLADAVINNAGHVAFRGSFDTAQSEFSPQPIANWFFGEDKLAKAVAWELGRVPGIAQTASFAAVRTPFLADDGRILFSADTAFTARRGIWSSSDSGPLELVAITGAQIPLGSPGMEFQTISVNAASTGAGDVFFYGTASSLPDGAVRPGIWHGQSFAHTRPLVEQHDQVPGFPTGAEFDAIHEPEVTQSGRVLFHATVRQSGMPSTRGIWSYDAATGLTFAVKQRDSTPGLPAGTSYAFGAPSQRIATTSNGRFAFGSYLDGPDIGPDTNYGLFAEELNNTIRLVAWKGQSAVGAPDDAVFRDFFITGNTQAIDVNNGGNVAFMARIGHAVGTSTPLSIWSEGSGDLELVAMVGGAAPGYTNDVNFADFVDPWGSTYPLALNNRGQIAFRGRVAGTGISSANDEGIWAQDRSGELRLIIKEGDAVETNPGEFRTIQALRFVGNFGTHSGFNDAGELVFHATFVGGGNGIFVSDAVAVPEPSSCVIVLAMAFMALIGIRRRDNKDHAVHPSRPMSSKNVACRSFVSCLSWRSMRARKSATSPQISANFASSRRSTCSSNAGTSRSTSRRNS